MLKCERCKEEVKGHLFDFQDNDDGYQVYVIEDEQGTTYEGGFCKECFIGKFAKEIYYN